MRKRNVARKLSVHVERRRLSAWDKESARLVDSFALVESRSGVVMRWLRSEDWANKEAARVNAGGEV